MLRLDLVLLAWDAGDDDVGDSQTFLEAHLGSLDDVVWQMGRPCAVLAAVSTVELLDVTDVYAEDAGSVIRQERSQRSSYDLGSAGRRKHRGLVS